jgi:hypothetical protein
LYGNVVSFDDRALEGSEPLTPPHKLSCPLKETFMHPDVENAIEQIDAAFFSGDTFDSGENLAKIKEYVERWNRKISDNEEWAKTHIPCTFTSVWDNGAEITTDAVYDPSTGKAEAEDSDSDPGSSCLVREYITLEGMYVESKEGTEIEVCTTCHEYVLDPLTVRNGIKQCRNSNCESRT